MDQGFYKNTPFDDFTKWQLKPACTYNSLLSPLRVSWINCRGLNIFKNYLISKISILNEQKKIFDNYTLFMGVNLLFNFLLE